MAPTRQKNPAPPVLQVNGHDAAGDGLPEVEVVDGDVRTEVIDSGAEQQQAADPGIEDLKAQLAEEKRKREAIEAEAATLRSQQQAGQREVVDNRMLVLDATIQRQQGEKKAILARMKEAKEAGDYDAEVNATDELNTINIDLRATTRGKAALENEIEEGRYNPQSQQRSGGDDPIEKFITDNKTHPKAANWLRNHRDYALDAGKNAALLRAHNFALGHDDVEMNSDKYFELLEQKLGLRQAEEDANDGGQRQQPAQQQRTSPPPVAPVSRGNGMGGGGREIMQGITDLGNGKYRTTPEIRAFAESIGMTVQDYVKSAVDLKNEGQIH